MPSDDTTRLPPDGLSAHAPANAICPQESEHVPSVNRSTHGRHSLLDDQGNQSQPGLTATTIHELEKDRKDEDQAPSTDIAMTVDERGVAEEESLRSDSTSPGMTEQRVQCRPFAAPLELNRPASTATVSDTLEFSRIRVLPNYPSSYLRYGSKFVGTQQSDKQIYHVEVDIKHVNLSSSSICGYLRIDDLTPDHPTLTTFFEGEIVGPKYSFVTRHPHWGATEKTDMQHWERFPAFRALPRTARRPEYRHTNVAQRENIFMRWKEKFLVPDHRASVRHGASFDGFYYICFNQVKGSVAGIYFHAESTNRYQQLELKHVPDRFSLGSMEFR